MSFSILSITESGNSQLDSWVSIIGQIIIPIVIFFIVNIFFEAEKQRKAQIRALDYLTLHFHQMLQECLKLTNNEKRRKACLENSSMSQLQKTIKMLFIWLKPLH